MKRKISAEATLPDDIYVALVATLFAAKASLVLSACATSFVSVMVAIRSANSIIAVGSAVLICTAIARLWLFHAFQSIDLATIRRQTGRRWERFAALTAIAHSGMFGILVAVTFTQVGDMVDNLLMDATACGIASGITSRTAGRPSIATGQLTALLFPVFLGCVWHMTVPYLVLAALNILFLLGSLDMCRNLHSDMVRLLMAKREMTGLAASLVSKNAVLDATLDNMSHGLCVYDANHKTVIANKRYEELLQLPRAMGRPGVSVRDIITFRLAAAGQVDLIDETVASFEERLSNGQAMSIVWQIGDGRRLAMSQQPMTDGGAVVLFDDVTERDQMEARIAHKARHDALTDLPNRTNFAERLRQKLDALQGDAGLALFCLDLDRFKAVNDMFGHAAGDALLCMVAQRIRVAVGSDMLPARIGGDEFVIIAWNIDKKRAVAFAEGLVKTISAPYQLGESLASIGVSIGVSYTTERGTGSQTLISEGDMALYRAKRAGRGTVCLFSPDLEEETVFHRTIEMELRLAVQRGDFAVYYQQRVDPSNSRILGFEALLRWMHPTRGLILPDAFVPLAEETGLITAIGEWVLRQACRDAASWPEQLRVSVNVSPAQFESSDVHAIVESALKASGLKADRLDLEVTESLRLVDSERNRDMLHKIRAMGVRIAIDDLGTGFASFNGLQAFNFDSIKIDRSFTRDLEHDRKALPIVRAMVTLAKDLGIPTVAEGVESQRQLEILRSLGCDEVQGFLFGQPMEARDLGSLFALQSVHRQTAAA